MSCITENRKVFQTDQILCPMFHITHLFPEVKETLNLQQITMEPFASVYPTLKA